MKEYLKKACFYANKELSSIGFKRIGKSSVWAEDRDYFMIFFEIQPHTYLDGIFINVAISFLWGKNDDNDDFSYDCIERVHVNGDEFIPYVNDIVFEKYIESAVILSKKTIEQYRRYSDLGYAINQLNPWGATEMVGSIWREYDLVLLYFYSRFYEEGKKHFSILVNYLNNNTCERGRLIKWRKQLLEKCVYIEETIYRDIDSAQLYVISLIKNKRNVLKNNKKYSAILK